MASPSTPPQNKHHYEADTVRRTRFFHAIDTRASNIIIKDVCEAENVSHNTGKEWLKQRQRLGDAASRRIGKFRSGRPKKMSSDTMNMMLDPQQNPVRDQPWPAQIEHFQLDVAPRTLRAAFNQRSPRASRFKKAIVRSISNKNKLLRKQYAESHKTHTVVDYWQYVHFTDEAHFDSDQMFQERTLREEGTRYEQENMQTMSDMKEVKLHVAASISWHHKGALQFYNDEHDMSDIQIQKPRKPRKRKHETNDEHRQRVVE